ncbi:MAG: helix-turn-helix domain-containing protein [Ligilactobacillus animalis]|uniref:helix-turn-helix domain-containing protein n=1 Tax=Ligilactobacillus animalis TaxID=1605 RepID=UPI00242CCD69|nr:helix-turn-helix transcriptional regulator [Ligilactobacillus animalis]MCI5942395.1 helix-turn-helix domain-containing protein [Ligilactobacillus animalis]
MWQKVVAKRKKLGYSNYKLSVITGIPESTLRSYEKGVEPSFKNMCKIADALKVDIGYFRR